MNFTKTASVVHALGSAIVNRFGAHGKPIQSLTQFATVAPLAQHASAAYGHEAVPGWSVDASLSSNNYKTYVKDGQAVVAYRGTDPTNASDLLADAHILTGKQASSARFKEAVSVANAARGKYSDVVLTGHSLGAAQAIHAGKTTGLKTIAFNPGAGVEPWYKAVFSKWRANSNITTYRTRNDVISANAASLGGKVYTVRQTQGVDAHSIRNFV